MKKDCRGEDHMSRLEIMSPTRARIVMEGLYKDLERRIESSPPGLCPVDMARAFLELCHAQTCGCLLYTSLCSFLTKNEYRI